MVTLLYMVHLKAEKEARKENSSGKIFDVVSEKRNHLLS